MKPDAKSVASHTGKPVRHAKAPPKTSLPKTTQKARHFPSERLAADSSTAKRLWLEQNAPQLEVSMFGIPTLPSGPEPRLQKLVWDYVNKSPLSAPKEGWRDYAPTVLMALIGEPLGHLRRLAEKGSPAAVAGIVELTAGLTLFLEHEATKHPERFRVLAESMFVWPVRLARKKAHNDPVYALLKSLNVGAKTPDPRERLGRVRDSKSLPCLAVSLLARLEDIRSLHPIFRLRKPGAIQPPSSPFSESTAGEWAKKAWRLLCSDNGGSPELNPELARFGKHRKHHYEQPVPTGRSTDKTRQANVKDGIRDSLTKTIRRLAADKILRKVPGK